MPLRQRCHRLTLVAWANWKMATRRIADRLGITDMTELRIYDVEDEHFTPRLVERARALMTFI